MPGSDFASAISTSQLASNASSGTKRKRGMDKKFYAVRTGYKPGVYSTYADCLAQVKGFKKAIFKSFSTLTDAERFVAGENPIDSASASSHPKFYAVRSGRVPGIYTEWAQVQEQITGWQKPKHRCFSTRAEAQRFIDGGDVVPKNEASPNTTPILDDSDAFFAYNDGISQLSEASQAPERKIAKKNGSDGSRKSPLNTKENYEEVYEPGTGPLPPDAEDGFDPNIMLDSDSGKLVYKTGEQRQAMKRAPSGGSMTGPIRIHTDGSSIGNGTTGAFAGVGVYFGSGDRRNISERLQGTRQTNQRAELTAVQRALEIVPKNREVVIITDSKYSIDCVTNWFQNWRRNGWKNATGKAVENRDLIENILARIEERDRLRPKSTTFEWVKGHSTTEGNVQADKLAVEGARSGAQSV